MAERLTKKDKPILKNQMEDNMSVNERTAIKRLWKYENIMEKYGIESLDTLEHIIKKGQVINSTIEGFAKEAYNEMQTDRDTWKRACELACQIIIGGYCDGMEDTTDWEDAIYQWKEDNNIETYGIGVEELLGYLLEQAKMEGNDERN